MGLMCICSSSPVRKKSLHSGRQAIYSSFIRKETWATAIIGEVNTQQSPHEKTTRESENSSKQHVERWTSRFQSWQVLYWPDSNSAHHTGTIIGWQSPVYINFIDFKKAFDMIDGNTMWRIMVHYGIPPEDCEYNTQLVWWYDLPCDS